MKSILDHGFVRLVDTMGDDKAIVDAARVSYGDGTKTVSDDRNLIRYMVRHAHTSPLEMCEIKLHLKMPIFVARQWIRHRTANVNEISGRYSIMKDEFYVPKSENVAIQSSTNNQGRGDNINPERAKDVIDLIDYANRASYMDYKHLVTEGPFFNDFGDGCEGYAVARELARVVLPLNTYTEFYWKIDLHNLLHFLRLRTDSHAQFEIREYANAIAEIVKEWVPLVWEAFEDYKLNAVTLSVGEQRYLEELVHSYAGEDFAERTCEFAMKNYGLSKRELREFAQKLQVMGLIY